MSDPMEVDKRDDKDKEKKEDEHKKGKNDMDKDVQTVLDVDYKVKDDVMEEEEETIADPKPSTAVREQVELVVAETKSTGKLADGIERLLLIEKKQRQAEEEGNTLYIAKTILELCHDSQDWRLLIEQIAVITRRRSQFRRVVIKVVQFGMSLLDKTPDKETQLQMMNALINVTEGKIFVEVERARLTKKMALIKEAEGKIAEAADILQELQIETFGSMVKREKCDFLLEQVRLCLAKNDFVRAGIIRNKITTKIMSNLEELEIRYWNLSLIYFYHHNRNYLELSKAYRRLKDLLKSPEDKVQSLANSVFALILAPFGNEQWDLLNKVLEAESKMLEQLPVLRELLRLLTTWELVSWPLLPEMSEYLKAFRFVGVKDENQTFGALLHDRIIQHNIRVVEKYYNQISTQRLAHFLGVSIEETEKYVSDMVNGGTIFARTDRLDGKIRFRKKETTNSILNDWRSNIDKLLELVDQTCHQIHKEMVIHSGKNKNKTGK